MIAQIVFLKREVIFFSYFLLLAIDICYLRYKKKKKLSVKSVSLQQNVMFFFMWSFVNLFLVVFYLPTQIRLLSLNTRYFGALKWNF